ncbi:hypothetical protein [Dyella terrae]|uniref:hypothetical protein n=1 Tax=Dyella terrae TaxID=522259 RepID=UPI001EFE245F|nr:hypothetical protein [Dyella terrae]ULU26793.1 hypothetical protein DYST_03741 [Dyella terrae]
MANLFMRREFALEGRIDFRPLFVVIGFNLATGFASYVVFNTLAEHSMADGAIALGSSISPSVQRMASLSVDPSRCAFVLSVQWILALLYLPLLLFVYWPFSKVIRVAVREWRKRQPSESIGDNRALAFYAFFALLIPWALGDLRNYRLSNSL